MTKFLQRESNKITIASFYEGYQLSKYNLEPEYQRLSVWTEEKRSFLIDSILRNYPIPPIFLHQKINEETGITTYDVIDGKQRLISIIEFIENKISVSTEYSEPNDEQQDDTAAPSSPIAGSNFDDLTGELAEYKSRFWRYVIPVEYVDTGDQGVIDSIFDRLNRNGEPLTGQELRNANYYGTHLLNLVEQLSKDNFWKDRLKNIDRARMEDLEFLSELVFYIKEGKELTANQAVLDKLYKRYSNIDDNEVDQLTHSFQDTTTYMSNLDIDFDDLKINGVSHLYGIFAFCSKCIQERQNQKAISTKLYEFFDHLRSGHLDEVPVKAYKESMSSNTKSSGQRKKRTDALHEFCIKL